MSSLFGSTKKQNNQKVINDFKNKMISGKKYSDKDFSKISSNLKENKINSPKYRTLKNSRNKIILN